MNDEEGLCHASARSEAEQAREAEFLCHPERGAKRSSRTRRAVRVRAFCRVRRNGILQGYRESGAFRSGCLFCWFETGNTKPKICVILSAERSGAVELCALCASERFAACGETGSRRNTVKATVLTQSSRILVPLCFRTLAACRRSALVESRQDPVTATSAATPRRCTPSRFDFAHSAPLRMTQSFDMLARQGSRGFSQKQRLP